MHTTRTTHRLRRMLGLAAVPALVFAMAACGDDDESSGESGSGGGGDSSSFCEDARALQESAADVDSSDVDAVGDAMTAMQNLDPPAEIAEDWELLFNPGELSIGENGELPEDYEAASERVTAYMEDECGLSE
jgi:hypothetical protein